VAAPLALLYWIIGRRVREAWVAGLSAGLFGLAVGVFPVLAAGFRVFDLVRYHSERPIQIESTWGAVILASQYFGLGTVTIADTYGSKNVLVSWDYILKTASVVGPFAWLAFVSWWLWRTLNAAGDQRSRDVAFLSAICAVFTGWMVFGKVFSPQYLTWLMPLAVVAALASSTNSAWQFLAVLGLTQDISPFLFSMGFANTAYPWFGLVVLCRNLLLLTWATLLLRAARRSEPGRERRVGRLAPRRCSSWLRHVPG
jgi:hypothetical protein